MTYSNLPAPLAAFLRAVQTRDADALLRAFAGDAVLHDCGEEHQGDEIKVWSDRYLQCTGIRAVNVARRDGKTIVTVIVWDDNRTSASIPLQLDWCFTVAGGRISALTVSQEPALELPIPVLAFIRATNTLDLDMLLATFADDALVNDQLHDVWGTQAIRGWAARELIGVRMTIYVVKVVKHYGHTIVTANVDGDYDKRGLPEPLVVTLYFSISDNKIVQLVILPNLLAPMASAPLFGGSST
jgi:ketosteroid isomerase-like protein